MNGRSRRGLGIVGAMGMVALLSSSPAWAQMGVAAAEDGRWHFDNSPYFWGSGLEGTVSFKGLPEQHVEASFSDILDHFDIGLLVHFEGRKGRAGFGTDLLYLNLGTDVGAGLPILGRLDLQADVRQISWEGFGFYRLARGGKEPGNPGFADVLVGVRYYGTSAQIEGDGFEGTKRTFDFADAILGLRGYAPLGRKAGLRGRVDIGTFGSDVTWQLEGDLAFRVSERWTFEAGYRYMDIDYDKGSGLDRKLYQVTLKGPLIAAHYGW